VHGLLQLVANAWRAILHRKHVHWPIVGVFAAGSIAVGLAMLRIAFEPTRATLYLLMGISPLLVWLPQSWVRLDASRPAQAPSWVFACAIPLSMAGTAAGGLVLDRLSDVNFKRYLRLIVTVIGVVYLAQAARLYLLA
jgi:hypothetical protein